MSMDLREKVLAAAIEAISEGGTAQVSMRDVARRAGVSHQAPYHHFGSREGILAALVERAFISLHTRMANTTDPHALRGAGRAYVTFALEEPALFDVMFRPDLVDLSRYPAASTAAEQTHSALVALVDAHTGGHDDAKVSVVWAVVHGLAGLLRTRAMSADIDACLDFFLAGIEHARREREDQPRL